MSRQQQPPSRCVVRDVAIPHNCVEFQALCDALRRNDPTVTTVVTNRSTTPEGYSRRLGEALLSNNNSVVSEIDLYLSFLLEGPYRYYRGELIIGSSATSLLAWIEGSSSLTTVKLHARYGILLDRSEWTPPILLQQVLNAMKKNPNIRSFHVYDSKFDVALLTEYLSTTPHASVLQSLTIVVLSSSASEMNQAAQAIAGLSGLQELSLTCTIAFLKLLPAHSTLLLRELDVDFGHSSAEMALFSSILSSSRDLQRVTIEHVDLDDGNWDLVRSGLQSNPSITHLKLFYCQIVIQSSSVAAQQNLRHLDLCFWTIQRLCLGRPSSLAQMLCGSLLQHVTFDFRDFTERLATEFFATLSMNSSAVQLRSMHLMGCLLWDMSLYLSSTLYLRHFTFTFIQSRDHGEFYVPSTFLRSLRQNASLHTVEFKSWHGQSYTLSDSVSRFIQAYTTRNRELSNLTKSCFSAAANSAESNMSGTTGTSNRCGNDAASPRKKRFPTLCLVSQQAERMAPNSLLQGLLASSDALATASGSHHLGKRVAGEALKDI